jgi:integrase
VTDVLADYATEKKEKISAPRIGCAIAALTSFWQNRMVSDVTPRTSAAYERHRALCSAGTVRRELGVLQAAINLSHENGVLTRPVSVKLPEKPEARDRWLTPGEAARLIRAARTRHARLYLPLFILLGLYTGRRKGAILSLRWHQVDLERGVIDFDGSARKTNKRKGLIPIPPKLLPHLIRARRRGTEMGYVLHRNGERLGDIKKGFEAAARRARIEDVCPHTLRHTAATWIARGGKVSVDDAADYLSMSVETLRRIYRHHHPDFLREVAQNIGRHRPRNVRVIGKGF